MTTLWLLSRSPNRSSLFELRPYTRDPYQADWFPQPTRILAPSWSTGEAFVPRGLVKLSIGEEGAWYGSVAYAGAQPRAPLTSMPVRVLGGMA